MLGTTLVSAASERRRSSNAAPSPSVPVAVAPSGSFDAFLLIVERNIFNPNRVGRTRATAEEKPLRVDEIALVGTMEFEQRHLAFFDSPDAAYRKALGVGESVADFKVQSIAADRVELLQGDKPVTVKLAHQLRRTEGGEWSVRALPSAAPVAPSAAGGLVAVRPAEATPEPEIPADASEVLKRLMKNREKQLK